MTTVHYFLKDQTRNKPKTTSASDTNHRIAQARAKSSGKGATCHGEQIFNGDGTKFIDTSTAKVGIEDLNTGLIGVATQQRCDGVC